MNIDLVVNEALPAAVEFAGQIRAGVPRWGMTLGGSGSDVIVAVGGDGTVLQAVRRGLELDRPVLGFNLGRIGFLAEAEPTELEETMIRLAAGEFEVLERVTVASRLCGGEWVSGVNDVVVEKIESQRLVVLALEVDGQEFLTYRADGIVVATSTGSTAYAFSAGGPLVDPALPALLVVPVAAHSLFGRTLVLPATAVICCRVMADRPVRVSVDGVEVGSLQQDDFVEIRQGDRPARFIDLRHESFPSRVTRKFGLR